MSVQSGSKYVCWRTVRIRWYYRWCSRCEEGPLIRELFHESFIQTKVSGDNENEISSDIEIKVDGMGFNEMDVDEPVPEKAVR